MNEELKKVSIINILVNQKDNKIKLELSYETNKTDAKIYLLINDKEKIWQKSKVSQIADSLNLLYSCVEIESITKNIKILIKEDEKIYNTILLDNKKQSILEKDDEYKIFDKNYCINIKKTEIDIKPKKIFDKFKYELKKQKYYLNKYHKLCWYRLFKTKPKYYLFNDHIPFGDDNAEALFRYINKYDKKMAKKSYFIIDKKSTRIKDLKKVGKVLKYGSVLHKLKYINSKMVISSHASYFDRVYNPFSEKEMFMYKDIINKKFIFLQHGVIVNDLHEMLNRSKIIADLFITSTYFECKNIESTQYLYEPKMIACTGLARFDRLNNNCKKIILIAPTWRSFLTDAEYSNEEKQQFEKSEFYLRYTQLLLNKDLQECIRKNNYKIKFLLHPIFRKYKELMRVVENENTSILATNDIKYSELFNECSIFITDYSSTHFDVAYLRKPIIYYQFDKEHHSLSHYKKGYFDYETDGFGEVIEEENKLVQKIIFYLENNCKIEEKYDKRLLNTFKFLDKDNSKRIHEQIKLIDLDNGLNYRFNNVH